MIIKSKDIDPNSQSAAWVIAKMLGYDPIISGNAVHIVVPRPDWESGKEYRAIDTTSPAIVLGLVKLLVREDVPIYVEGFCADTYEETILICAINTKPEHDVPDELVGGSKWSF